jgi:hypothetical protein
MSTGQLFRPGNRDFNGRFTAAIAEEVVYPNDWVAMSVTDPTSHGYEWEGRSLLAHEFIHCVLTDTDAAYPTEGLQLGCVVNTELGNAPDLYDVRELSVPVGGLVIIQSDGIHASMRANSTTFGNLVQSAVAGEADQTLTDTNVNVSMGVNFKGAGTTSGSRVSAGDSTFSAGCIRCDW